MPKREIIWRPRRDDLENSHVARFMRRHGVADAQTLRQRAAIDPGWFYPAIIEDLGVEWLRPYEKLRNTSRGLPFTEWFLGGRINLVHNCLDRHIAAGHGDELAVVAEAEDGGATSLTYAQLDERVRRVATALVSLGVGAGDAVGFYMPMTAEVVVGLLACLKIGAVPTPVFAGFGPEALAARMADAEAKVLLTADSVRRRGKTIALKPVADEARRRALSVEKVVVLRSAGGPTSMTPGVDSWWHELESASPPAAMTAALDSSARSLILFTSGTTGRPKGAVHTHAGVQIVTAKEVGYHMDVRPGDVMFWLTDIGWMMGPWEILGVLFHRGTVVLMDGAPDFPSADRVWSIVARRRVTHLGLAPTVVRLLASHGAPPAERWDLSSVRMLGSTGEPWDEESYLWYFRHAGGGRCPVINISGGTELMGCLLAPLAVEPLTPTTLQGPAIGMDVDVVDDNCQPVCGAVGYLVCRNAAPNMTRGFLNDPQRYLDAYFSRFGESIWFHGDWATIDEDGFWYLTGRADDTLKIAGKRIGPGEVEAAAVSHPGVREAAAVGLHDEIKGTRLVVVAVAAPGFTPGPELSREIAAHIAGQMGPSMRPAEVRWIDALPVTRSGKIVRGVIRRVISGEAAGDISTVANPDALAALAPDRPTD